MTLAVEPKPSVHPRGFKLIELLVTVAIIALLVALILPAMPDARRSARRTQCLGNLRNIAVALLNYEQEYQALPPAYTVDADGNRLHSWRTLILPYLDEKPLYDKIDLSKPWDDPANEFARNRAIAVFQCPDNTGPPNHTTYLASVGANACFRPAAPRRLAEITDGPSDTLMVIEAPLDQSVPWMSPHDANEALILKIGTKSKLAHDGMVAAALGDGRARTISADLPLPVRRALISIAAGDEVGDY